MRRLADFCYRRRRFVVLGWIGVLVGLFALSMAFAGKFRTEFELPASESARAIDLLEERGISERSGFTGQIVFRADQGVNDPAVRRTIEDFLARVAAAVEGEEIISPYDPEHSYQISQDGKIAYAEINMSNREQEEFVEAADAIKALQREVSLPGL